MMVVSVCSRVGHTPGSHTTPVPFELKFTAQVAAAQYSENRVKSAKSSAETSRLTVSIEKLKCLSTDLGLLDKHVQASLRNPVRKEEHHKVRFPETFLNKDNRD